MIGTHLDLAEKTAGMQILLKGEMALLDGFVTLPASLYADLSPTLVASMDASSFSRTSPTCRSMSIRSWCTVGWPSSGHSAVLKCSTPRSTRPRGAGMLSWSSISTTPRVSIGLARRVIQESNTASFDGVFEVIAISDDANTITIQRDTDPGTWEGGGVVPRRGFQITLEGGVDLNIPAVTTLTLEGGVGIEFIAPSLQDDPDLEIDSPSTPR